MSENTKSNKIIPPNRRLPAPSVEKKSIAKTVFRWIKRVVFGFIALIIFYLLLCTGGLIYLHSHNPPITMVQFQRAVEARLNHTDYKRQSYYRSLQRISDNLEHAVVAAEDTRFYQHHGVDFQELEKVIEEAEEKGEKLRGASTITQQLVKNLFLFTSRSYFRKLLEYPLAFIAELILSKDRILELYLNVVEWGPGIYGAEAASRYYYHQTARWLTRDQSARLAAVLPDPIHRSPIAMDYYSRIILHRMEVFGW